MDFSDLADWLDFVDGQSEACSSSQCPSPPHDATAEHSKTEMMETAEESMVVPAKRKRRHCFNEDAADEIRKTGGVYAKKRADGRVLTHIVFPKILKNDVRRLFPQMIVNAHNAGDGAVLAAFLQTFGTHDLRFLHQIKDHVFDRLRQLTISGQRDMVFFRSRLLDLIPDSIIQLDVARVVARSDGTAVVQCDVGFTGTLMLTNYKLSNSVGQPEAIEAMEKQEAVSVSHGGAHESLLVCSLLMQAEGGFCDLSRAMTREVHVRARQRVCLHLTPNNMIHLMINEVLEDD